MKLKIQKNTHNVPVLHTDDLVLYTAIRDHLLTLKNENSITPYVLTNTTVLDSILGKFEDQPFGDQEYFDRILIINKMINLANKANYDIILYYFKSDLIDLTTPSYN